MHADQSFLPEYALFERTCESGLSSIRPLVPGSADKGAAGWNFGTAWPPSYGAFGRMRALLALRQALALRPKRVLEVAAGDASLAAQLAMEGCEVFANDLRREVLEKSVLDFTNGDRIRLAPGSLFELDPGKLGRFDLVIACEVIEHVAHTVDFLKQLGRFVGPTGKLLVTTPNGAYFRSRLPTHSEVTDFTALESEQFKPDADGHLFLLTPGEMRALARSAGFEVERLDLWASPALSGGIGLQRLSSRHACRLAYKIEESCDRLPDRVREKVLSSMSIVLRPM